MRAFPRIANASCKRLRRFVNSNLMTIELFWYLQPRNQFQNKTAELWRI